MILGQFVGVATRPELCRQGHTRESRTWQQSGKMAKKGDFAGVESFTLDDQVFLSLGEFYDFAISILSCHP
jgi:hypothetical protein